MLLRALATVLTGGLLAVLAGATPPATASRDVLDMPALQSALAPRALGEEPRGRPGPASPPARMRRPAAGRKRARRERTLKRENVGGASWHAPSARDTQRLR